MPESASRIAAARFTGLIPWNRVSKSQAPRRDHNFVMRIEVDAKSNPGEFLENAWRSVRVGVAFFHDGGGADNVVSRRFAAGGLQRNARGEALPLRGLAHRNEVIALGPRSDLFLHDRAAGSELRDDGEQTSLGRCGDAAVGGVIAEPDH